VAGHGFQRDALGDEGADALQGDDLLKFDAIANETLMSGFTRDNLPFTSGQ